MTELTVDVLREILTHLPSDFIVEYNHDAITAPVTDKIIIDVSGKRLILK